MDIVEDGVIAVGDDGVGEAFELFEVVDHTATEEGGTILEGGFIDDNLGALGLDTLHDSLDRGLTEVIAI